MRLFNITPVKHGTIGHPANKDGENSWRTTTGAKLVPCAGVAAYSDQGGYSYRIHPPYREYPEVRLWLFAPAVMQRRLGKTFKGYGRFTMIPAEGVPEDVRRQMIVALVRMRLRGEVRG